ncbi:conserved hypothetical protein [gamma proteobacterium HdN1]|nr:conserved hypothetical protein [gamma proteobacterium HdN1]
MSRTVVLGASPKAERYSNQAIRLLQKYGHEVVPVNPAFAEIEGLPTAKTLSDVQGEVDTLTLYVGPDRGEPLLAEMLALHPKRVIMNPGTESKRLADALQASGVEVVEGCTLVMLRTGQY